MSCGKILLTQHGDELAVTPILARTPFIPQSVRKGKSLGFSAAGNTPASRRFNARRNKKRTVRELGQDPTGANAAAVAAPPEEDAEPKKQKPRRRKGVAAAIIAKVNKKRRTDPVALQQEMLTTAAESVAAAVAIKPAASSGVARSLFDDYEMTESMRDTDDNSSTTATEVAVHVKVEVKRDPDSLGSYGLAQLYAPFSGQQQKKSSLSGSKRNSSSRRSGSNDPPSWRFYALLDAQEGRTAPCWLCESCNIEWLEDHESKITKQELLYLIRTGSTSDQKARHFLYSLERP